MSRPASSLADADAAMRAAGARAVLGGLVAQAAGVDADGDAWELFVPVETRELAELVAERMRARLAAARRVVAADPAAYPDLVELLDPCEVVVELRGGTWGVAAKASE